jgi:hypothetical protein
LFSSIFVPVENVFIFTYSGGLKRGLYLEFISIPHAATAVTIATLQIVK